MLEEPLDPHKRYMFAEMPHGVMVRKVEANRPCGEVTMTLRFSPSSAF